MVGRATNADASGPPAHIKVPPSRFHVIMIVIDLGQLVIQDSQVSDLGQLVIYDSQGFMIVIDLGQLVIQDSQ